MYVREDMADISVHVDGVQYGDSWATVEGGNLEADDAKTRPGGMGREVSAGGPASRDDLTVTTQFSDIVAGWHGTLEARVGIGRVKVGINYMGTERSPIGRSQTIQGTLKSVATPDMGDGSDVGMYTLVVSCDESAGA